MTKGWIYCISNRSMPGLLKVGQTKNCPTLRAEKLQTTGVPLPFDIEFAKKTTDYEKKEKTIHNLLDALKTRLNPKREFFKVDLSVVKNIFDLIDGDYFSKESKDEEESLILKDILIDGQKIRHSTGNNQFIEGNYCIGDNKIIIQNKKYTLKELHQLHCKNNNIENLKYTLLNYEFQVDKKWVSLIDFF